MSLGLALFIACLAGISLLGLARWALGLPASSLEGEPLPPLPAPYSHIRSGLLWFHSPTCGPCRSMRPVIEALEEQGQAHAVDVTEHLDVARALGVMATPTTVCVEDGRILWVRTGPISAAALRQHS